MTWSYDDVPDLEGKTIIVTGANSGIGFEATKHLADHGAHVVLACRRVGAAQEAVSQIRAFTERGEATVMELDLADLESVERFAVEFLARFERLDVLVNNAGLMAIPRRESAQGFEMQLGVNHLGHFALTGRLMPLLRRTEASRVVNVSSNAHKMGRMDFNDLQSQRGYSKWAAYGQSKLANLLFTRELQRRFEEAGEDAIAVACHPGYAATELSGRGPKMEGARLMGALTALADRLVAQSAEDGAMPTVYAATSPEVQGGDYIGPSGWQEIKGPPERVEPAGRAKKGEDARRLWEVSERLTGVTVGL